MNDRLHCSFSVGGSGRVRLSASLDGVGPVVDTEVPTRCHVTRAPVGQRLVHELGIWLCDSCVDIDADWPVDFRGARGLEQRFQAVVAHMPEWVT